MIRVAGAENSNQAQEVATRMPLPKPDVPVLPEAVAHPGGSTSSENMRELWPHLSEAIAKHFAERNHPSTSFSDSPKEALGTASERTSQAAMGTHQGGKEHSTSYEKEIVTLRAAMEELKANPNPERREHARKLLTEVKGKQSSEPKQENSEQTRRQLDDECPIEGDVCPNCQYPEEQLTVQGFFDKFNGQYINFDLCCGCQCVDLAQEYNRDVVGAVNQTLTGNAKDIWTPGNYPAEYYTPIANTATNFPNQGDIVIWDGGGIISEYGHIAVCQSADVNSLTTFDQNWQEGSSCQTVHHPDYTKVLGWLRPNQ